MSEPSDLVESLRSATVHPDSLRAAWKALRRVGANVTRDNKIPRPGGGPWTADDVDDLVQDLFASGRFDRLILDAKNDGHFMASASKTIKRMIIDRLRASGQSALHDRVVNVLEKGAFVSVGGEFGLADHDPGVRFTRDEAPLHQAARRVSVSIYPFKPNSARSSSFASRADLEAVLVAVLDEAGCPVEASTLVRVVAYRVAMGRVPDILDGDPLPPAALDGILTGAAVTTAERIWAQLTPTQRKVLPLMDQPARKAGDGIGLGKTAVADAMNAVRAMVKEHGGGLDDGEERDLLHALLDLCERDTGQDGPMGREPSQENDHGAP